MHRKDKFVFDKLPFERKWIFTSKNIDVKSNIYMKEFTKQGEVGDPYRKAHLFYRYLVDKLK